MNPRLLQLGAKVLPDWEWIPSFPGNNPTYIQTPQGDGHTLDSPEVRSGMLPAYMAEALMLHIRDRVFTQDAADIYMETIPAIHGYRCEWQEAPSRIAAALVALGRITLDEAREMVG